MTQILDVYSNDLKNVDTSFISKEEGHELQYSVDNVDRLVNSVLLLIQKKAYEYSNTHQKFPVSELIQQGYIGARIAAEKWLKSTSDKRKEYDVLFVTYCTPYIFKYMDLSFKESYDYSLNNQSFDITSSIKFSIQENKTDDIYISEYVRNQLEIESEKLFSCLTESEKRCLFLNFGVGVDAPHSRNEIARVENTHKVNILYKLNRIFDKLKKNTNHDSFELLNRYIMYLPELNSWNIK